MVDQAQDVETESLDKEIEMQSLHSSSSSSHHTSHDRHAAGEIDDDVELGRKNSMTEKGDIEAYPDAVNDPMNEEYSGGDKRGEEGKSNRKILNVLSRISTKSSWKDPGPPPDGGWSGWTQGTYFLLAHLFMATIWKTGSWESHQVPSDLFSPPSTAN
jgi:hypothetical protein